MAEHEHGTMNTQSQEKTFEGFVKFVTRSIMVIIGILIFMAIFAR
ncbi:aa3-type cytochrome c oxidase subunit IV [uncultured Sulfitobacter sp.]|nr:aa3-type cytochrome c oxidase subunit IV [uncultured Sulfitobacter sp.]